MMKQRIPDPQQQTAERITQALDILRLAVMKDAFLDALANPVPEQDRLSWLWRILEPQVQRRLENRLDRRFRESRMPARKTLEGFDFTFQPKLDKNLILELATLRFLDRGSNILLAGMSGTGKSHLAMALGLIACTANRSVLYSTSADMLTRLQASLADDSLQFALLPYVRTELLIIDEVGLEQVERNNASRSGLMQKVLFPRYQEARSTIITSNLPWEAWGDYLDDHLGAAAILDRLIHHSNIIVIDGPSWRGHQHKLDSQRRTDPGQTGSNPAN